MSSPGNQEDVDVDRNNVPVRVPDDSIAKAMYWLYCITSVIEVQEEEEPDLHRLTDFKNYKSLSERLIDKLVIWCGILNVTDLQMHCFIINTRLNWGQGQNHFYTMGEARKLIQITSELIIGGVVRKISRILIVNLDWFKRNLTQPREIFTMARCDRIRGAEGLRLEVGSLAYYYRHMYKPKPEVGVLGKVITALPSQVPYTEEGGAKAEPIAILVYYLNCIFRVLDLKHVLLDYDHLVGFKDFWCLNEVQLDSLIEWCLSHFAPEKLKGKCIFENDELCEGKGVRFVSHEEAHSLLGKSCPPSLSIPLSKKPITVKEIMLFSNFWFMQNFVRPLSYFSSRINRIRDQGALEWPEEEDYICLEPKCEVNNDGDKRFYKFQSIAKREPKSKLLYYIETMLDIVDLTAEYDSIKTLRYPVTDDQLGTLLYWVNQLHPDNLSRCIFTVSFDDGEEVVRFLTTPGEKENTAMIHSERLFSVLEARERGLPAASHVNIGGRVRAVKNILVTLRELDSWYFDPYDKLWPGQRGPSQPERNSHLIPVVRQPPHPTDPECPSKDKGICIGFCIILGVLIPILVIWFA